MDTIQRAKYEYCLNIGDSALILSQRLSDWCGHGPLLEEDIALTNISLDLLGQARNFLTLAAEIEGAGKTEDTLAYFRESLDFRNLLITELPNTDYAYTMTRQFFYDVYMYLLFDKLKDCPDEKIAAISGKSFKEITYHLRHSSYWMRCFGQGTDESKSKVQTAVNNLWAYTGDFFDVNVHTQALVEMDIVPDPQVLAQEWHLKVKELFDMASIQMPESRYMHLGGRQGKHTEHLSHLLAEMQSVQRAHPGLEW